MIWLEGGFESMRLDALREFMAFKANGSIES